MPNNMFPFVFAGFVVFAAFLFFVFVVVEWSVYGPKMEDSEEVEQLVDEGKFRLNTMKPSIIGVELGTQTSVAYISKHSSELYSQIVPFATEYHVAYFTDAGFVNRRIKDGTELHRKVRKLHSELKR